MKSIRQAAILELIEKQDIETQGQLIEALQSAGIASTQATVSRDIKELRLIKVAGQRSTYRYAKPGHREAELNDRMIRLLSDSVQGVEYAGQIVVVKTLSGSANVAAEVIDNMDWSEVLGTIAGDNTIFIAVRDRNDSSEVAGRIRKYLAGHGERGAR